MLKVNSDVKSLLEDFQRDGFVLLRNVFFDEARSTLEHDIRTVGNEFFGTTPVPFDLKNYQPKHTLHRGEFYNLLRYVPSLCALSGCQEILNMSRALGLRVPFVMKASNIRMDLPDEDEFLFHWHQDITYLLGSLNSITYWFPLTPVNKSNSTIEVIPGSHRSGIVPFDYTGSEALQKNKIMSPKDIRLHEEPCEPSIFIEAEPGDVVIFSQHLLHRSTPNRSSLSRWTVQVRHADIDAQFIAAGCPLGDRNNIYSYPDYYGINGILNIAQKQ
jgi:hypothetical protein